MYPVKNHLVKSIFILVVIFISACEFEPFEPGSQELIIKDSALYNHLQLVAEEPETEFLSVGCVEFLYPFTLYNYDENAELIRKLAIGNNEDFTTALVNLEEGHAISLSYPITGLLADGTPVNINSNDELLSSLASCIDEEIERIIGECNGIASAEDCSWNITESLPEDSPYLNANMKVDGNNEVVFTVGDTTYEGTWIFYFIGNDLHLNIFFEYDDTNTPTPENGLLPIKEDWNMDWVIHSIDDEKIEIVKEDTLAFTLARTCEDSDEDSDGN